MGRIVQSRAGLRRGGSVMAEAEICDAVACCQNQTAQSSQEGEEWIRQSTICTAG